MVDLIQQAAKKRASRLFYRMARRFIRAAKISAIEGQGSVAVVTVPKDVYDNFIASTESIDRIFQRQINEG